MYNTLILTAELIPYKFLVTPSLYKIATAKLLSQ